MSKSRNDLNRNQVAYGMIVSGTGKKQVFADKRSKRSKDKRNSWQHDEQFNEGGNHERE